MSDHNPAPRPNLPSLSASNKLTPLTVNPPPSMGSTSPVQQIKLPPISFLSTGSSSHSSHSPLLPPQQHLNTQQPLPNVYSRPNFSDVSGLLNNDNQDIKYQPPQLQPPQQSSAVLQNLPQQPTPILASSSGLPPSTGSFSNYQQRPVLPSSLPSEAPLQPLTQQNLNPLTTPSHLSSSQTQSQSHLSTVPVASEITKPDVEEESDEAIIKYYEDKYGYNDFTQEEKHDILQHEKRARIEKSMNPNYKTFLCYSIIKRLNAAPLVDKSKTSTAVDTNILNNDNVSKSTENPSHINAIPKKFVKREVSVNNDDVLQYASKFPRKHLGSIIYTSTPTRETYRQLHLFKDSKINPQFPSKIVPLLPELSDHINSLVTVRIPSFQIIDLLNNENYIKRKIWGTDIYTDDSDVLLVLKHNGFLPTQDSEVEQLVPNEGTVKTTPGNIDNKQNIQQNVSNFKHFLNIIGGDIHVDLIILPRLKTYKGVYRNGINSRDWLTGHDGVSFALFGVRYGEKNSAIDSSNDTEIKKRKLKELYELENETDGSKEIASWKLDYKAWRTVKQQIELGKDKSSPPEKESISENKE